MAKLFAIMLAMAAASGCAPGDIGNGKAVTASDVEKIGNGSAELTTRSGDGEFVLSTDLAADTKVVTAAEARKLLEQCRAKACRSMQIESCDRCYIQASRDGSGYAITHRAGPPPEIFTAIRKSDGKLLAIPDDAFDPDLGGSRFDFDETIALLTGYIDGGKEPANIKWRKTELLP